jgi:hypothetical protein
MAGVGGRGFERLDRDPFGLGGRRGGGWRSAADDRFGGLDCLSEDAGGGIFLVFSCVLCLFSWKWWSCDAGLYTLSAATMMVAAAVGALILDR